MVQERSTNCQGGAISCLGTRRQEEAACTSFEMLRSLFRIRVLMVACDALADKYGQAIIATAMYMSACYSAMCSDKSSPLTPLAPPPVYTNIYIYRLYNWFDKLTIFIHPLGCTPASRRRPPAPSLIARGFIGSSQNPNRFLVARTDGNSLSMNGIH